jgi:GT2 family glycosyltransferase
MPVKTKKPSVAVVTLNWNGLKDTLECIESVFACKYPHEMVVVDNGSTDGSARVLSDLYGSIMHLIAHKVNLGYSKGMNSGLNYAFQNKEVDYCLVINNDVRVDKKVIKALVETAEKHEDAGFVTGKVYYYDNPDVLQTVGKKSHPILLNGGHIGRNEKDTGQFDTERELDFCDDIFWLVNRKVWENTGGYDPEFFLQAEDFEWQIRAKKAGFRIYYTPEAKIWHKESMKLGKASPLKLYYDTRNPIIAIFKHMDAEFCRRYLRYYFRDRVAIPIVWNLLKLRLRHVWAIKTGFLSFLLWLTLNKAGLKH